VNVTVVGVVADVVTADVKLPVNILSTTTVIPRVQRLTPAQHCLHHDNDYNSQPTAAITATTFHLNPETLISNKEFGAQYLCSVVWRDFAGKVI